MASITRQNDSSEQAPTDRSPNGAAMAAFLAAGAGSFAMGFFVILHEMGILTAPALHAGAGGVSGRTTFAAVSWLLAWLVLHLRWRGRDVDSRRIMPVTLVLLLIGLAFTFPPLWSLLPGT